jgi:hypothetical protein
VCSVARGQPTFFNCDIQGAINVSGDGTKPVLDGCKIYQSRTCGVNITDNSCPVIKNCLITENIGAGIKMLRGATATISDNRIVKNVVASVMAGDDCKFGMTNNVVCDGVLDKDVVVVPADSVNKIHKRTIRQYVQVQLASSMSSNVSSTTHTSTSTTTAPVSIPAGSINAGGFGAAEFQAVYSSSPDSDSDDFCAADHWDPELR